MRRHWLGASAVALLSAAAASRGPGALPEAATPAPIAIIAIDAADWQAIDRLIPTGRVPGFAALKASGAVGVVHPDPPLLSPIIWTTVATGRRPEDHRVLDFMVDQPGGGQVPVGGGSRRTKALWEIFSDAGRPVLVAGWWATWPPDRVRGAIVSDRVAVPHIKVDRTATDLVYPPDRLTEVAAVRVDPQSIDYDALNRIVPLTRAEFDKAAAEAESTGLYRNRFAHARAALAGTRTYAAAAVRLAPLVQPAFLAVYFDLVDTMSHLFVSDPQRRARVVAAAYAEVDERMRAVAGALDPDTFVIVMSDHGFYGPEAGIDEDPADLTAGAAAWHRPYGIVAAAPAGVMTGSRKHEPLSLGTLSPLDIAPTVLARAGLPVGGDMPGRVVSALTGGAAVTRISSHGLHRLPEQSTATDRRAAAAELDRLRSLGYVSGAGAVTAQARVNLGEILFRKGAFRDAIRELEAAQAAEPANQRGALWLARAYAASDRPDDAARVYDRLMRATTSGSLDPMIVLAATDLDVGRGQQAAAGARLAKVPAAIQQSPEVLMARAEVADAERKPAEAERLFRAAYGAAPASVETLSRLVDWLVRNSRATAAVQVTQEAVARFPASAERHALAGEAALAARRPADAAQAFRRARALVPEAASARLGLARAEVLLQRGKAALEALGDLSGREADMLRGAAHSIDANWAAAIESYERAARDGTPSIELLNALGNAQLEAGRAGDAVITLGRSLALKADQPAVRALLERAQLQAKRPGR